MGSIFKNPLVLAETVVGSLLDTRSVVLYKQPEVDINQLLSANNLLGESADAVQKALEFIIEKTELEELFTGIGVPILSKINGFNMFGISYVNAEVNPSSDLCQHPVETGQVITDNAILNPVKATVRIVMPTAFYTRIYDQIKKYFEKKQFIILQTKFASYRNMVITAMPFKLENQSVDRAQIDLNLEQVLLVSPQYTSATENTDNNINESSTLNPNDSDTADLGRVSATESATDIAV